MTTRFNFDRLEHPRLDQPRLEHPRRRPRRPRPFSLAAAFALVAVALTGCEAGGDEELGDAPPADAPGVAGDTASSPITLADAGLQTPESVLYDPQADVYLVSNINGGPVAADGNGFISRVAPDGTVQQLRWIDGAAGDQVRLNAPKGMALKGDTLFVSDIDSVRAFNRSSGQPLGARGVPGASFLNDLAVGPDGTLYVTDTGVDASFQPTGTAAIHAFRDGGVETVAEGEELNNPNGIIVDGNSLVMVPFNAATVQRIPLNGDSISTVATLPGGQLDGIVRMGDGSYLVSSWETQAVYRVPAGGGQPEAVVEGVPSPADIGWDDQRQRVLVPVFQENRLIFERIQ